MVDFTSILSKTGADCEKPGVIPAGAYDMTVVGFATGESAKNKTPYVEIETKIVSPHEDVDMEEYAKVKNPQDRSFKTKFWLSEDALFRLKDFLIKLGFETENRTFLEMLNEMAGCSVVGIVTHSLGQDKETVYASVDKFMKA